MSFAEHGEGGVITGLYNREVKKGVAGDGQHVLLQALKFTAGNLVHSALPAEI